MTETQEEWLARFHAGHRDTLESCYREYFELAMHTAGSLLAGADQETVVHEVFCKLMESASARSSFRGGSMASWLRTVVRNQAIDYLRAHRRETILDPATCEPTSTAAAPDISAELRILLDRFRREQVPPEWERVFQARFIDELSQREAAEALRMRRTTLAYQEQRLRARLRRFVLRQEVV